MDTKVSVNCAVCDHEMRIKKYRTKECDNHFCSDSCLSNYQSENLSGKDSPSWKEGVDWVPYGAGYYKNREKAIERDGGECVICGDENIEVHHIRPRIDYRQDNEVPPEANKVNNLVVLCVKHHNEYEGMYAELSANEFKSKVLSQ